MNVPLTDAIGLHIYRELMHREARCAAGWHENYGPEAILKPPNPEMMVNLGLFSKRASVPMPLEVQRASPLRRRTAQPLCEPLSPVAPLALLAHRLAPLRVLLITVRELRRERSVQAANITRFEKATYPHRTDAPVSEMSVKIYGEAAWHSQPKKGNGAPATYAPPQPPANRWTKRKWDVDRMQHVQEGLGPVHVHGREALEQGWRREP